MKTYRTYDVARLRGPAAGVALTEEFVYWREQSGEPQQIQRAPFPRGPDHALTKPGEWLVDMNVSGQTILYAVSPSGDPTVSDCRVMRLDPDGAETLIADDQWQAGQPRLVGADVYWVTGDLDTALFTAAVPQRARIHRKTPDGAVTTFESITAFGTYAVVPEGILTINILRQKLTLHPFQGAPRELFVGESLAGPAVDTNGIFYVATGPRAARPTNRIVRIGPSGAEDYVTGGSAYGNLLVFDDQLYFTEANGITRKSRDGEPELLVRSRTADHLAVSRAGLAWSVGTHEGKNWMIMTSDLKEPPPDPLKP